MLRILFACLVLVQALVASGAPAGRFDQNLGRAASDTALAKKEGAHGTIPREAETVLKAIQERNGEPLPGYVGGAVFRNRERRLPAGEYREYDVHPRWVGRSRGAERLVIERRTGKAYYTGDHYRTFTPMN